MTAVAVMEASPGVERDQAIDKWCASVWPHSATATPQWPISWCATPSSLAWRVERSEREAGATAGDTSKEHRPATRAAAL